MSAVRKVGFTHRYMKAANVLITKEDLFQLCSMFGVLLENKQASSTYLYVTTLDVLKEISTLDYYTRVPQSV